MKWLLLMLMLCFSIGAALVWRIWPKQPARQSVPIHNVNSRLAFEQLEPALASATASPAMNQEAVLPRKLPAQSDLPSSTQVRWAMPAASEQPAKGGSSETLPRARAALDDLSQLAMQVEHDPENLDFRFALAAGQMRLRLWTLALIELEKIAVARPNDLAVRFNLAIAYQGAARLIDARTAWDHVLVLDPESIEARAYRGEVLLDLGEYGAAASDLRFVVDAQPDDDAAKLNLAAALQGAGQLQPALDIVERLLVESPQHLPALKRAAAIAIALSETDLANAVDHHQRAADFARRAQEVAPRDPPIVQLVNEINSRSP